MRVAFHAPMKAPDHPVASGDRLVARNLVEALARAGHEVQLVSRFRSYDRGDPARQQKLARLGAKLARRLVRRLDQPGLRPDLWFTYHLYHKAPDHLGPAVSAALDIPYVVAEASVAGKQQGGPFDRGYRDSVAALTHADLVLTLNPNDAAGVRPHLRPGVPMVALAPFVDGAPIRAARLGRDAERMRLADRHGLDPRRPWLVTAAMMRADQKLSSYLILAEALALLPQSSFHVLIAGAGPAESDVRALFAERSVAATFLGEVEAIAMPALLSAADLFVWPAVKEAFGMALVEAQAAGLPVVAGHSPGVAGVVEDGVTGSLVPQADPQAFAAAVEALLDPDRRRQFGAAARQRAEAQHDVGSAARKLDTALGETLRRFRAARQITRTIEKVG